ncbi:hypothetical protein GALMADRAFT_261628 [Galerina marginata CBS 339.88]|uniref:RING-type domain-containing protein n=1 Tax=Galerina marginata (strain CBS 339.88) TaxID=685588 RepID=A0A067TUL5_GALM3|nr:hypothetical protein GALMADRAFT_261628 [Galerina marginata CBS 339.88]
MLQCQVCFEDFGDMAYCLPCGHIYCLTCISDLQQRSTLRNQSISCPGCRKIVSPRIGSDNVRKVFLDGLPPDALTLQTDLAIKNRELEKLKVELARANAAIATALTANERQVRDVTEQLSQLSEDYQEEVDEHRKTRRKLRAKDAELKELKDTQRQAAAQSSPQVSPSVFSFPSVWSLMPTVSPASIFTGWSSTSVDSDQTLVEASEISTSVDPDQTLVEASEPEEFKDSLPHEGEFLLSSSASPPGSILEAMLDQLGSRMSTTPLSPQPAQAEELERPRARARGHTRINTQPPPQTPQVRREQPKTRELKRGHEILSRGYRHPAKTAVPECTAADGYHFFSGKGTNQYATKYTCTICHFSCSESRRY